ncbi:hypothetical protein A2U01_0096616, partial [Trifolium medium]|nr:hypothetical protein [Trifolium medium]
MVGDSMMVDNGQRGVEERRQRADLRKAVAAAGKSK